MEDDMTVPVTRTNYRPEELRDLAKRCGNGAQARRAITLILEGHSRQDAAEAQNMDRQTLRDRVHRYNEFGPEGLNDRPKSGRKVFLDEGQLKVISDWLEKGPETDGLVRWRVQDVKNKIQTNFGVKYSMEGTRRLMQRLGFRHVSPRPLLPKAKPKDQEEFRENFQDIVKDAVGPDKAGRTAWFQDEGRIGGNAGTAVGVQEQPPADRLRPPLRLRLPFRSRMCRKDARSWPHRRPTQHP